ncbi:Gfo/Idh/MocA family oxidoreductase [Botrimarina sp.]|uniref:Gfo/Idh/MocA family oxidoreductase n=1 Tax=Botrimarina sp. TaxID=2795802 RepID=UPI0032EAE31D
MAKRLGFVDDALDNFHANTYLDAVRGPLAERGWEVAGATALQQDAGRAWADSKRVAYYDSPAELADAVDAIAVLAPSTPETHLGLCEAVLSAGKPTFVDKTFAPDAATAQQIFDLADRHAAPIQTTSALRTTNVQTLAGQLEAPLEGVAVWAGGASWHEYGVHPVELAVSCLGPDAERITACGTDTRPVMAIEFSGGRVATIHFDAGEYVPFVAMLTTRLGVRHVEVDDSRLFVDAAAAILDFFDAGRALVPRDETMAVMRVLDASGRPEARHGWHTL